jgi:hypothetical protein
LRENRNVNDKPGTTCAPSLFAKEDAVDRWGEKNGVKRSEAIRCLIEQALVKRK